MAKDEKTVKVEPDAWLIDSWNYEVNGKKYHIEKGGTEVPADEADELVRASRAQGALLRKVKDN